MTISSHSNISPIQPPPVQHTAPAGKSEPESADSVHLSPAAAKQAKGSDGDSDAS